MVGEPILTIVGGLTSDAELRYTQNGLAVASFTIASTPRTFDRAKNEYVDGETLFLRASIWRDYAEHVAESLHKGTQVVATGRLKQRSYTTKEGEKRTSIELEVDDIGPVLRFATAQVTRSGSRTQSNNQAQQRAEQGQQQWYGPGQAAQPQQSQWQQPPTQQAPQAGDYQPMYAQPSQGVPQQNPTPVQQPAVPQQQVTSQQLWQPSQATTGIDGADGVTYDDNTPF